MKKFWKWWLKKNKWEVDTNFPYYLKKAVIAVGPHTSNTDFILGLAVRSFLNLEHIRYLGKKELFNPPHGFIFRKLGGTPVDRSSKTNLVEQVVNAFKSHDEFLLAISPEGTRSKVDRLKTGFYHIARQAEVPIVLVAFDYGLKKVYYDQPFYPTGNEKEDFRKILEFFATVTGKIPDQGLQNFALNE